MLSEGSQEVFEQAAASFQDAWYRYALYLIGSSGCAFDAEDILQAAYVATFRAGPDFAHVQQVNGYIRLAIDSAFGRWRVWREIFVTLDGASSSDLPSDAPTTMGRIVSQELAEAFREALQDLTAQERDAFFLFYVARPPWKQDDIAEKQGVTQQAVSTRISRAGAKLRAALEGRIRSLPRGSVELAIKAIVDEGRSNMCPPARADQRRSRIQD